VTGGVGGAETGSAERQSLIPEFALLTTVVLWSSTFVITKDQLAVFTPFAFIFIRFLLMASMAVAIMVIQLRAFPLPERSDWLRFAAAGLTGYTIYQIGFVFGLNHTSVFASSLLVATSPLFTMLILAAIGERPAWASWIGVAVAIGGVSIFLVDQRSGDRSLTGDLFSLMAAVSFAVYGIINRPLVKRYPASVSTAYAMVLGTIPLLIICAPDALEHGWGEVSGRSWLAVLYMVVFPVYLAYILWNFGIQRRGAAVASSFGLLVPILSGVLSAVIFGEQFGLSKVAGGTMVLVGLLAIRLGALRARSRVLTTGA
jgi:drug/metabolite transporter (DMT)-like permease